MRKLWPKGFDALIRWFFVRIDWEVYSKSIMKTFLLKLYVTWHDVCGWHDQFTWSENGVLYLDEEMMIIY